ncbi:C40 family peptidase [Rhizobium sp. YTUHZ045]|uniref:C40 family peptidase n=1 Tax=Rhizobium sp. YTUHZ045 TaxID=2962888 RepID=UPI003DA92F40
MERFVGIPYVPHGRNYGGADCWGILFLYYRDVLGIQIPSYTAEMAEVDFHRHEIAQLIAAEREQQWTEVSTPAKGDCVLMRVGRDESHVGVFIGNGQMLHSEGPDPSRIERVGDMRWRNRIVGYFRYSPC